MLIKLCQLFFFVIISTILNYIILAGFLNFNLEIYVFFAAIEIISLLIYFYYSLSSKIDDLKK